MRLFSIALCMILLFTLLAVIFSYPLIFNFNSAISYTHAPAEGFSIAPLIQGDHLLLYYTYWLFKDYFFTPGQELFREPYTFAVPNWPRPYEPKEMPSSVLFLLFSLFGNIFAYNAMVILSFLLSGIFTFLLAKKYLEDIPSSVIAGTIFAVSPFRLAQLFGGHPTGFILFWIPLIIYLYELLWEKRKWIYGFIAGLCIFFMCMEEHHMGYYTALFTVVFWAYKFVFCDKRDKSRSFQRGIKPRWKNYAVPSSSPQQAAGFLENGRDKLNILQFVLLLIPVGAGWIAAGLYMLYVKSIVFNISIAHSGRTFDEIRLYAPVIKQFFQRVNPDSEKYVYLGIITSLLFIIGLPKILLLTIKNKRQKHAFPYLFYFLVFFLSLLLSLGPNLKYFPIYKLCYKIIPFFYFPRSPARMYMFTLIAISLLSGYGAKITLQYFKNKYLKYSVFCLIILLLCIDYHPYPKIGLSKITYSNKTYDYIKSANPTKPILEIPLWPGDSSWTSIYQYYTTIYQIPIINGYSPFVTQQYINEIFWPLVSLNMGIINTEQYDLLKKLDIKYINLHEEAYPKKVNPFPFRTALENLNKSPFLNLVINDGPMYLFQILDEPKNLPVEKYTMPSKIGVFYKCGGMPHRIGKIVEDKDAIEDTALFADLIVKEPQHLSFGPWELFPPGRYKVLFRIKKSQYTSTSIEITTDKGKKIIMAKDLTNEGDINNYSDYVLHFTIDRLTELEFRIIYGGKGPVWADYIYLLCEEENDPAWHYQAKDLFHIGREKDNAIYAAAELDPSGDLIFGPCRRYPEGKYKIGFKIKAEKLTKEKSAILKITNANNEKALASSTLENIPTEYTTYRLNTTLTKPSVLEFKVEFLKKIPIYVESIKIRREK